jgi:preprotein translocase subunit SecY
MKQFINTIKNIFSIQELKERLLYTFLFLAVFRLGSFVVLPAVNPAMLEDGDGSGILGLLDTFLGGAFSNASVFGLGIMPYISASIILQLLVVAVPFFQKLSKEGESGRKKINQYTRVLTIAVAVAQSIGYLATTIPQEAIRPDFNGVYFFLTSVPLIVAGTMFCMWLGEKITEKGIGNGISMIIMIGIISRLPSAIIKEFVSKEMTGVMFAFIELIILFVVVVFVVAITQATRRIPIEYARQMVGNRVVRGERQFLPLKFNSAGVMPIIFAQALMFLPALFASTFRESLDIADKIGSTFSDVTSWQYNLVNALLIVIFTYFYTAIAVNPQQISEDLRRNNGYIPGVQPGEATTEYISTIIDRITLPGALFLALIAIMPAIAKVAGVNQELAYFFGGTSLLIMVGVILDTLQQIESYLLMQQYEGMMKTDRFSGTPEAMATL